MNKLLLPIAIALSISLIASGCTRTHRKEGPIPRTGPTIAEIYRGAAAHGTVDGHMRPIHRGDVDLHSYTRHSGNEIRQLFPTVNNPGLVTYIFPHLAQGGLPVPGSTTAFRMYADDAFALPGEAPLFRTDESNR